MVLEIPVAVNVLIEPFKRIFLDAQIQSQIDAKRRF
jgi:hypothetical protein